MTTFESVPLHRLLEREATEALLRDFEALLPGSELSLIGSDGRHFAGWNNPPAADVAPALLQGHDGQPVRVADPRQRLQPLVARSQPVGTLVARGPISEDVLHILQRCLTLLLDEALDKRAIARETLDRYRELNLLYQAGETIGACLNPEEIPRLELSEARRVIAADAGLVLLPAAEGDVALEIKASFGSAETVETLWAISQALIVQVQQTGRPDILTQEDSAALSGTQSVCAPLKAREHVLGVVLLGRRAGQAMFTASDQKLLMALSSQGAMALERAWLHQQEIKRQRLEEELAIGQRIQLSLLPEACPTIPGWEFAATYRAAQQVGGDYYDFFALPEAPHRLGLVIADVTNKGVPAALMMAFSRAIIRTEAMRGHNPAAVLEQANRLIAQDNRSQLYLSAFYATLDTLSGQLTYTSGGHDHPLWYRAAAGECRELVARGMILGAFERVSLEEHAIELAPGDLLVFYTDGVTEAMDAGDQLFDEERLRATVMAHAGASAGQMLQAIVNAVEAFIGDTPPSDDFTLFVVKRQGAA